MTCCPLTCSGKKKTLAALFLSTCISIPSVGLAESVATSEWNITADRIIRYEDPSSIVAEGSIILEKRVKLPPRQKQPSSKGSSWDDLLGETPQKTELSAGELDDQIEGKAIYKTTVTIEADWLAYDVENEQIKARGNVKITGDEDKLTASTADVDLNTETGSFTNAVIIRKDDQLHLEGENITKTGLNTYRIQDGWAITCKVEDGETPPWSLASSDTKITEGGYAVMRHARFNIKGVPILYTPYMVLPVKNKRQTGFLLPEFSNSSSGGFAINTPFFWNISNSVDATFFPEIYFDRGVMPGAEFRYVRDAESKGSIMASYLDDDLSGSDKTTSYYKETDFEHSNTDRYWIRGKADHNIGDWQTRVDIDLVSDRDYLTEFNSGYTGFNESDDRFLSEYGRGFDNKTDTTRQNQAVALKSWDGMSLQAGLIAYNDVRSTKTKNSQEDPLWTLPSVYFSGIVPVGSSGVSFNWVSDYVHYWREDGIGGNRIDLHPSLSSSIPLSPYLESRAEVGVRETFYKIEEYGDSTWAYSDTQNRVLGDFEVEVASPLARTFSLSENDTLDHQLRPYVQYNYIPDVDQDELPDFDSVDLIDNESKITYGIDNFFDGLIDGTDREYGYVKILQSYSLLGSDSDEPFSDINLRLKLKPLTKLFVEYETDLNIYGDDFVRHSFESRYTNSRGDYFAIDYSFNDSEDTSSKIEQINATLKTRILPRWSTRVEVEHSIADDETNEANFALRYNAPCWGVEFQSQYTPSDTRFIVLFNLANLGSPIGVGD